MLTLECPTRCLPYRYTEYVDFIPVDIQAHHLVDHLIRRRVDWGVMYREASAGRFWASHGSTRERWFAAIVDEMRWRGMWPLSFATSLGGWAVRSGFVCLPSRVGECNGRCRRLLVCRRMTGCFHN